MLQKQPTTLITFVYYEKETTQSKHHNLLNLYYLDDYSTDPDVYTGKYQQDTGRLIFPCGN